MKQLSKTILFIIVLINVIVISEAYTGNESLYWMLLITAPMLMLAVINVRKKKTFC
jgi:hypothetical protein